MGYVSLILFFPLKLYIDSITLKLSLQSGYWGLLDSQVTTNGILVTLSDFYIVSVALLIIGNKSDKKKSKIILILFLLYNFIMMFLEEEVNI
ncbi:hypothetical protein [Caloramator sp. mosi_1]|uniref:hypothetical protein n=1 Tax=Caloramator sp. mosi_1 TaxID=3023090 RepID=UPI003FCE518B